jgi:hypothetical protein
MLGARLDRLKWNSRTISWILVDRGTVFSWRHPSPPLILPTPQVLPPRVSRVARCCSSRPPLFIPNRPVTLSLALGKTGKRALENSTFKLYLHGHSVTSMSESNQRGNKKGTQVVYTQQQLQNITQLCHADHRFFGLTERRAFPFDLLVRSLCPSIIGHNQVKAGLLLCLLGGTPPPSQSTDKGNSIRWNSHILIVGDPGTYYVIAREVLLCRVCTHFSSTSCSNLRLLLFFVIQVWERVKCSWPPVGWRPGVSLSVGILRRRQD